MRILVAEDHPVLARSLAEGLRDEGYAVDLTFTGDEAAHLLEVHPYDCAVLDIMLPGQSGWDIVQRLRRGGSVSGATAGAKASEGRHTPVLFLTALDSVDDRVKGLDLGADDYLVKPFAWQELTARVRSLIRRSHGQQDAVIRVGDLEIDTVAKTVRRAGTPIELTAREYALLHYLANRQGQVVSRQEIWDHVYDQADENTSNVVDVYIGYLRAKIDKPFGSRLIHTRRGMGYMLSAEGHEEGEPKGETPS